MRVGVFGGAFDPIHLGHLLVAEDVHRRLRLESLLFVPTCSPPHRRTSAPYVHRLEMVRLAIEGWSPFRLCPIEEDRPGPSYTVATLQALRRLFPRDSLYLLVGSDQYREMPKWRCPELLTHLARLVVMERHGHPKTRLFPAHNPRRVRFLPIMKIGISAALVRARLAEGKHARYLLPTAVSDYIEGKRIYSS